MTPLEFCYWLKGYFELGEFVRPKDGNTTLSVPFTPEQVLLMRKHLDLVFQNVTEGVTLPEYDRDTASVAHVISRRC